MSTKKYAVYPGRVISQFDGDEHFIDAPTLMRLYRVNPAECIVVHPGFEDMAINVAGMISLRPRFDGNYQIQEPPR